MIEISDGRGKYSLKLDGERVGVLTYRDAGDRRVLVHTEVEPDYGGQGLATKIIEFALNDIREKGKRIVVVCPVVAHYLETHHDYDDLIDTVAGVGD